MGGVAELQRMCRSLLCVAAADGSILRLPEQRSPARGPFDVCVCVLRGPGPGPWEGPEMRRWAGCAEGPPCGDVTCAEPRAPSCCRGVSSGRRHRRGPPPSPAGARGASRPGPSVDPGVKAGERCLATREPSGVGCLIVDGLRRMGPSSREPCC